MQVAELERALRKRHPDSIASLIAATQPAEYSDKIAEMKGHLERVIADYEEHFEKLKTERVPLSDFDTQKELNVILQNKIENLNELLCARDKK